MRRPRAAAAALAAVLALTLGGCEIETGLGPTESASPSAKKKATRRAAGDDVSVRLRVISQSGSTMVLVPVKVNGQGPYDFILDTGASTSSVDERLVRRLDLPETGDTARVQGVTGSAEVPLVRVSRWTVGGQSLHSRSLTVIDLGETGIYGLLGSDELRRFGSVTVNFRTERLTLHDT